VATDYKLDLLSGRFSGWEEAAAVEGRVRSKHGMDGEQEFAHDRADSLELLEAAGIDEMAVEG